MFSVGDKLDLKKQDCIIEITGVYPGGQGGNKDDQYTIVIAGQRHKLPAPLLNLLFEKLDEQKFFIPVFDSALDLPTIESVEVLEEEVDQNVEEKEVKRRGRPTKS